MIFLQTSCAVVQPKRTVTTTVNTSVGDYGYTSSMVLSIICFLCGSWWALCCTIPALFAASSVSPLQLNKFQGIWGGGGGRGDGSVWGRSKFHFISLIVTGPQRYMFYMYLDHSIAVQFLQLAVSNKCHALWRWVTECREGIG